MTYKLPPPSDDKVCTPNHVRAAYAAGLADGAPKWLPIESAPRETEVFIGAFIDGDFKFGKAELFYEQGNVFEGETFSGWVWSVDDCLESVAENPTHWMPLLTAPEPEQFNAATLAQIAAVRPDLLPEMYGIQRKPNEF